MKYRQEIDGLRAIAVVSVMLFHANFQFFSGGFVGVDVFFVISGYLITSIILAEIEQGKFSLTNFYERRARRILPALSVVLLFCIILAWVLLSESELKTFSKSLITVPLFSSNFFFWRDGDYFETIAELKPLLHTWSLAVEEQFYIIFPIFIVLAKSKGRRKVTYLLLAVACVSFLLAQFGVYYAPVSAFFLLPTRAWELLAGAILASHSVNQAKTEVRFVIRQGLSLLGLAMIVISVVWFDKNLPFPGYYATLPVVGTLLVIGYADRQTLVAKILSTKLLVGIGIVSYSAYLWHQPVFAFANYHTPHLSLAVKLELLTVVFVLAILTWKLVESPFRNRKNFSKRFIFLSSATSSILLVFVAIGTTLLFGTTFGFRAESKLAEELSNNQAVYAHKVDERVFVKYRVQFENMSPETIVVGSSRIMQIGDHNFKGPVLNLGVSGASVEDIVAISDIAVQKFDPSTVLIGMDPWLFNSHSGQDRWKSLYGEFQSAMQTIYSTPSHSTQFGHALALTEQSRNYFAEIGFYIYNSVNLSSSIADIEGSEPRDRIRRDGSRIYNSTYAQKSQLKIAEAFEKLLDYGMTPYEFSLDDQSHFEAFLNHHRKNRRIVLVLSPYHPDLFAVMTKNKQIFVEIEKQFRSLAARSRVTLIGSFDPKLVGCAKVEFYDGMHPKDDCMKRLVDQL
jgi:peptidoglycan/LPS O-acetylase OafA/YrhL